jgi:hypothetical protein
MLKLYQKLGIIIQQSDGRWLASEVGRMERELKHAEDPSVREAMEAAKRSTERTLQQWEAAVHKQKQVRSVLTVIESNLHEFKLAMELRKADVAMNENTEAPDVSELQARLAATGQACDELVGRSSASRSRASRSRAPWRVHE